MIGLGDDDDCGGDSGDVGDVGDDDRHRKG